MNSFLNIGAQGGALAGRLGTPPSSPNGSGLLGFASPNTGMGNMPPLAPPPRPMVGTYGPTNPALATGNFGINFGQPPSGMLGGTMRPGSGSGSMAPSVGFGNLNFGSAPQNPGMGAEISSIFSKLHPEAQQALRAIPPQHLQALHGAGLIHPQLMGHLMGNR